MVKTNDRWFRISLILVGALINVFNYRLLQVPVVPVQWMKALVSMTSLVLICEGSRFLINRSRILMKAGIKRTLTVITIGVLYTMIILAASKLIRQYIMSGTWDFNSRVVSQFSVNNHLLTIGLFTYAFINAFINFLLLYGMYEVMYHYAKLHQTEKQKEVLEKEKLKAELNQLKGIVNPHFLFNNLNSLSALISEDPAKAEIFLDELTKVFRYLLRNNDTELTTLASELQFIQSYYHLLQIRHGAAINMEVEVDQKFEALLLPPLTLQLLVENAVKHNQLVKENPLQIHVYSTAGNKLVIKNNIAKKEGAVESTGIGLQNINSRYRMLNRQGITVEHGEKNFFVIIPLISE